VFVSFNFSLSLSSMASFSLISSPPLLPKPKDPSSHAFPHAPPFLLRMPHQPQHLQTPLLLPKIQSSRHQIAGISLVIYLVLFTLLGFLFKTFGLRSWPRSCLYYGVGCIQHSFIWISLIMLSLAFVFSSNPVPLKKCCALLNFHAL